MFSNEISLSNVVKKQYSFKVKAFFGSFGTLAIMQLLALLFSLGGSGGSGFYGSTMSIDIAYYSADVVIVFTILWAFISAIMITTRASRYDDFTFVTNRVSSSVANILFIGTASVVAGLSSVLCGYLIQLVAYFVRDQKVGFSLFEAPTEFLLAFGAVTLYALLFSALGYLVGMTIQLNKVFIVIIPALFVGLLILGVVSGYEEEVKAVLDFIFLESRFGLFALKVVAVSILMFVGATAIGNRLEVRK